MEKLISWYCGQMKAEPRIFHNRVIDYRYVPVNGCGSLNRPGAERCWNCGKPKEGKREAETHDRVSERPDTGNAQETA